MPPAGHAPTGGGGGKHHGHGNGNGGGDGGADFLDFKKSHEYNWNRLVWAHVSLLVCLFVCVFFRWL